MQSSRAEYDQSEWELKTLGWSAIALLVLKPLLGRSSGLRKLSPSSEQCNVGVCCDSWFEQSNN